MHLFFNVAVAIIPYDGINDVSDTVAVIPRERRTLTGGAWEKKKKA